MTEWPKEEGQEHWADSSALFLSLGGKSGQISWLVTC